MSLIDDLKASISNMTSLEIVTVVGAVKEDPTTHKLTVDWSTNPPAAFSKIDLVQGDITTAYAPSLLTDEYKELRAFHAEREKQGHDIIEANIKAVESLVTLALHLENPQAAP